MPNIDVLRSVTEDDAESAVRYSGKSLPIRDEETLADILSRMLGSKVTVGELADALEGSYVDLPIDDAAQLLEAYNRVIDIRFGEED